MERSGTPRGTDKNQPTSQGTADESSRVPFPESTPALPQSPLTWLAPPVEGKELKFRPENERWLRACLEGSCLQLPRSFANANQIIFYRASGRCKQRPLQRLKDLHRQFLRSSAAWRGRFLRHLLRIRLAHQAALLTGNILGSALDNLSTANSRFWPEMVPFQGFLDLNQANSITRTSGIPPRSLSNSRNTPLEQGAGLTDAFNRWERNRAARILEKQNRLQMSQVFPVSCIDDQMGLAFQGF